MVQIRAKGQSIPGAWDSLSSGDAGPYQRAASGRHMSTDRSRPRIFTLCFEGPGDSEDGPWGLRGEIEHLTLALPL